MVYYCVALLLSIITITLLYKKIPARFGFGVPQRNVSKYIVKERFGHLRYGLVLPEKDRGAHHNIGTGYSLMEVQVSRTKVLLSMMPLFLLSAFRDGVGTDYYPIYVTGFYAQGSYFESGFSLLIWLIRYFTDNYVYLFVVTSFLINYFFFRSVLEQSVDKTLSVLIYFLGSTYPASLGYVRQYLAVSIVCYALKHLLNGRYIVYFSFCIAAALFHTSAIMSLAFILPAILPSFSLKKYILFALASIVIFLLLAPQLFNLTSAILGYADYLEDPKYSSADGIVWWLLISTLQFIAYLAYMNHKSIHANRKFRFYLNMSLFLLMISIASFTLPLIRRVIPLLIPVTMFSIPYAISLQHSNFLRKVSVAFVLIVLSAYFVYTYYVSGSGDIFPYVSIFK